MTNKITKKKSLGFIVVVVFVLMPVCVWASKPSVPIERPGPQALKLALDELSVLEIRLTGDLEVVDEMVVPEDLKKSLHWNMINVNCREAGYTLSELTGKTLQLFRGPIIEPDNNSKWLEVYVLMDGGDVACVYKNNKSAIPGMYPANYNEKDLYKK